MQNIEDCIRSNPNKNIILYDAQCPLCISWRESIESHDKLKTIVFYDINLIVN